MKELFWILSLSRFKKDYNRLKEQLICQLSALLKYDWERSKKEVQGEPLRLVRLLCVIATPVFLALSLVCYIEEQRIKAISVIIFVVVICCTVMGLIEFAAKEGSASHKNNFVALYVIEEIAMGIMVVIAVIHIPQELRNGYMGASCFTGFLAIGLRLLENLQKAFENAKYCDCVKKIGDKYAGTADCK